MQNWKNYYIKSDPVFLSFYLLLFLHKIFFFKRRRRRRKDEWWIRDFSIKEAEVYMKTVPKKNVSSVILNGTKMAPKMEKSHSLQVYIMKTRP